MPAAEQKKKSQAIREKLEELAVFRQAERVFVYLATEGEPDTLELVEKYREEKSWAVWAGEKAVWLENNTVRVTEGIPRPSEAGTVAQWGEIDLVIMPGLAFDEKGNRLGRGAGWFDCQLENFTGKVVGLGWGWQCHGTVPTEPNDKKLDYLITECGVLEFGE